jgi:uncharacterized protein (DUF433 family)
MSTLSHWVGAGIVTPTREILNPEGGQIERGFSFSDVAYLRILRHFREEGVPMEYAVDALVHLQERFGPPGPRWRLARVFVDGRRIYAHQPDDWATTLATRGGGGQKVGETYFTDVFRDLRDRADSILIPEEFLDTVEIDPSVAGGLPVIKGTRMPTEVIRDLGRNLTPFEISKRFGFLSSTQIEGAIGFESYLDRGTQRAA